MNYKNIFLINFFGSYVTLMLFSLLSQARVIFKESFMIQTQMLHIFDNKFS